ncbi:MAG: hypothetical protein EPO32_03550 [Anaerolineae bacterium]|nr:MAG: hypothetical protein EPO32_03550 [Anaerolineae bacterium]
MHHHLFLFHWHPDEVDFLAAPLRAAGYRVSVEAEDGARGCRRIVAEPPSIVLIYLSRLPSHGIRTAAHLQERPSTRAIPVIFVGGEPEKVQSARAKVPSAQFIRPDQLFESLHSLLPPSPETPSQTKHDIRTEGIKLPFTNY